MKVIKSSIECHIEDNGPMYVDFSDYRVSFVLGLGFRGLAHETICVKAVNEREAVITAIKSRVSSLFITDDLKKYIEERFF